MMKWTGTLWRADRLFLKDNKDSHQHFALVYDNLKLKFRQYPAICTNYS